MGQCPRFAIAPRSIAAFALVFLATVGFAAGPALAQIRINEILPDPAGTDTWANELVEIYNAGPNPVDMTGWAIDDAVTIGQTAVRARIPEDLDASCSSNPIIGPGEFRVVHGITNAAQSYLNNTGDDVYLVSNRLLAATVVHQVTYPTASGHTGEVWAALPNGSSTFAWRTNSMCATNGSIGDVTAPNAVADLAAVPGGFPGEIRLTWTAPGDDGATGTASNYIFKVSHVTITSVTFDASADLDRWITEPIPHAGGTPETLLVSGFNPDSTWYFALKTQDEVPNTSAVSNSPGTAPQVGTLLNPDLGYTAYFGNLHSHTSYSDGVQTPTQAFSYARTGAPTPLDFLAVTDHNHQAGGFAMTPANYAMGLSEGAASNVDGSFVAIYGQEWGIISTGGHANLFESPALFGWEAGNYNVFVAQTDYTGLYRRFFENPPALYPAIVEWCHPNSGDFNSYAVTDTGKALVHLMNMISGPPFSTSITESDAGSTTGNEILFQDALRRGYRVSPTGDQDNHYATWGASTQVRTVVQAAGLTKSEVLGALNIRRCYASQDHNTRVQFSADGHAMGSAWTAPSGVRFAIHVSDPDVGATVAQIELLRGITGASNAVVVATNIGNADFAWRELTTFTPGTEAHYYARIRMSNNAIIWTGPVYVTYDPASATAVGDIRIGSELQMAVGPNPSLGRVVASFALPRDSRSADLSVYDAAGRRVKTLLAGPLAAGPHAITWTGIDDFGRLAPSGIFFLRLATEDRSVVRKVLLIR